MGEVLKTDKSTDKQRGVEIHLNPEQSAPDMPKSYDIEPVNEVAKITELLKNDGKGIITQILLDMDGVVPTQISLMMIDDILECLVNGSSEFNKLWVVDGQVVGFLVCTYQNQTELYLKYFGAKKIEGKKAPEALITGNIDKLLIKTRKHRTIQRLSLHGFNRALNWLLARRYGFRFDPKNDFSFATTEMGDLVSVPYLYLDITKTKPETEEIVPIDLAELMQALRARSINTTAPEFNIISDKIIRYLEVTKHAYPPNGWQSLADAISENFPALTQSDMGIAAAIEKHQKDGRTIRKKHRAELAANPASPPELITTQGELSLFRLTTAQQLKEESQAMGHCVGDSDHYINKIIAGTAEIWSIRNTYGTPLLTIEYIPQKRRVLQMKKVRDELLSGQEEWFSGFLSILSNLPTLDPPIVIDECKDINELDLGINEVITYSGQILKIKEYLSNKHNQEKILAGKVMLIPETTQEELLTYTKISGLTLDCTNLPVELKNFLTEVAGNITDDSENVIYNNLRKIDGDFITDQAECILPKVEYIGGDFLADGVDNIYLPSAQGFGGDFSTRLALSVSLPQAVNFDGMFNADEATILDLPKVKQIVGSFWAQSVIDLNLPEIDTFSSNLFLRTARTITMPKLKTIRGYFVSNRAREVVMPQLQNVGGDFWAEMVERIELPKAITFGGYFVVDAASYVNLPQTKTIAKFFHANSAITIELEQVESIMGDFQAKGVRSISMPELVTLGGHLNANEATSINFSQLESVNGDFLAIAASQIELPKLRRLEGCLLANSVTTIDMPELESCGNYFSVISATTVNLPLMKHIGDNLYVFSVEILSLPQAEKIGGAIFAYQAKQVFLPLVISICGMFQADNAEVISMPNLEEVGKFFSANSVKVANFPKLERCGGDIYLHSATSITIPFIAIHPECLHVEQLG